MFATLTITLYVVGRGMAFYPQYKIQVPAPLTPVIGISTEDLKAITPYAFVPSCD